ncbi:MAG: Na+/H+ antiporter NhaC family protein [Gammaproteobacteria bacterium]|nr:Na+/H+ antiporter NhaC family protein [Gammaproteobacteria bacterium]MDH5302710.1 Na+/H+ antiporter NhaC family protein [Gammaproteobacteria bacterium]MDH5321901.1 Na+/H+ antiporter NhaC family protein [Gammaproteobacteria bacterium]
MVTGATAGEVVSVSVAGDTLSGTAGADGRVVITDVLLAASGSIDIVASAGGDSAATTLRILPGWISLMPAFLAIAVALALRNVVPALLLGLWLGATALQSFSPLGALQGLMNTFAVYIVNALANPDHAAIIAFSMMIGGMVGIITRNGGMGSVVRKIVSRARTAIGGQVAVWLMGLMIFFDDYANTLVVGNTARPITDHLKISREKLAYIVDSTAAPVVCIALITTWIGYEVSLIDDALQGINELSGIPAYTIFLYSIPYSFYPILAVLFVLLVAVTGRDFGAMHAAEVRARQGQVVPTVGETMPALEGDSLEAKPNVPLRAANAFVPILVLIAGLGISLYITGEGDTITDIIGSSDPYKAMMWASFAGALAAAGMSIGQRILSAHETVDAWYGGARATLFGMIVLILAWSMSDITNDLNAKGYLISVLGDALPLVLVPTVVFLLASVTAFATGTSWGTMGILMPLVIPLSWAVMSVNGMTDLTDLHILYSAVACTLAGAVWGDHCSPISDTTVLSSIASGCDHIEHVRTQMPYALLVGAVAILFGTVPGAYGVSPWISILLGGAILFGVLRFFGRNADDSL